MRNAIEKFCAVLNSDRTLADIDATIEMGEALDVIVTTLSESGADSIDSVAEIVPADLFDNLTKEQTAILVMSFLQHNTEYVLGTIQQITGFPRQILEMSGLRGALAFMREPEIREVILARMQAARIQAAISARQAGVNPNCPVHGEPRPVCDLGGIGG